LFSDDLDVKDSTTTRPEWFDLNYDVHMNTGGSTGKFEAGTSSLVALGKKLNSYFRAELEYGYRQAGFDMVEGTLAAHETYKIREDHDQEEREQIVLENNELRQHGGYPHPFKEIAGGNISIHSIMANLFLDIPNKSGITPYVGGGIGIAFWDYEYSVCGFDAIPAAYAEMDSDRSVEILLDRSKQNVGSVYGEENGTDFAYQLMTGVALDFTEKIQGTVGYRLFGINNDLDYIAHSAEVGIRYSF